MRKFVGVVSVLACTSASPAVIVQYVQSGIASGTFALESFSPRPFTITATYDTANRVPYTFQVPQIPGYSADIIQGTVYLDGYGTFPINNTYRVWVTATGGYAGFSPSLDSQLSPIFSLQNNAFNSWDLATSIGPISGMSPGSGSIRTTAGTLYIIGQGLIPTTFQATVLPGPNTAALFLVGVGVLARRKRIS